jgi:hypothetical protein
MTEVWNVMTLKDGHVSLLTNLTADECRAAVQRLRGGDPWSQGAIYNRLLADLGLNAQAPMGGIGHVTGYTAGWNVDRCEWWGSQGGTLEIWPEPADYAARLAEAVKIAEAVKATNAAIDSARKALAA